MTDFERAVAEALRNLHTAWAFGGKTFDLSDDLAPRVAAAIDASAERFVVSHAEEWGGDAGTLLDEARDLALTALRGISGETPQR